MSKMFEPSLRQIEDWHYNYILKKKQPANTIEFKLELINVDIVSFEKAYCELLKKHESLRTRFPKINGEIMQEVISYSFDMHRLLLFDIGEQNENNFIKSKKKEICFHLKDLKNGNLSRGLLIVKKPQVGIFIFIIHHIISDFWSLNILKEELLSLYNSFKTEQLTEIKPQNLNLGNYIEKQNLIYREKQNIINKFWLSNLLTSEWHTDFSEMYRFLNQNNIDTNTLKAVKNWQTIRSKDLIRKPRGELFTTYIDSSVYASMQQFCAKNHVSTFGLLLASFSILANKLTRNESVLIQTHFSNRIEPMSRKVVGNLIGKALVHLSLNTQDSIHNYVHYAYRTYLESIINLLLNSEKLSPLKLTTRSFLFFNFKDKNMIGRQQQVNLTPLRQLNQHVESPLVCVSSEYQNTISMSWYYHLDYFNFEAIRLVTNEHASILKRMIANDSEKLIDILTQ